MTLSLKKSLFESGIILVSDIKIPVDAKDKDYYSMYNSLKVADAR
jgi:hypothetical protein